MKLSKRKIILLVTLMLFALGAYGYVASNQFVPPVVPEPNGYEFLLRAADQLHPRSGFYFLPETTDDVRAEIIATNRSVLELARQGLASDSAVPINWSAPDMQVHLDQVTEMREIARAFSAARFEAQAAGEMASAVQNGTDMLRLAKHTYQGGIVVDLLVGVAVQTMGLDSLAKTIHELDRDECEELLREIKPLTIGPVALERAASLDLEYAKQRMGILTYLMAVWQAPTNLQPAMRSAEVAVKRTQSFHKQLQIRIALRLFLLDNQRLPKLLAELEPEYVENGIDDPLSGKPLVYRPSGQSYELYSIGSNGTDDGGPSDVKKSDDAGLDPEE